MATATKTHFRLCHICGTANSMEGGLVTYCESCGKHLAPFYFFDESKAMGLRETGVYSDDRGSASGTCLPHKEYPPVWGLTAYWEPGSE